MDLDYQEIFETLGPGLYRLAFSYLKRRQEAEDVVQEVFVRLLKTEKRFADRTALKRWLMTVTANQCRDLLRSARWRKEVDLEDAAADRAQLTASDTRMDVQSALFQLPEKYRIVVYLYYYEGYGARDISRILRITQSAVLSRLERARDRLRQLLGGEWHEG